MIVVKAAGQGMWFDNGTPHDTDLNDIRRVVWRVMGAGFIMAMLACFWWIAAQFANERK
ncbi:MAG: hypothetical protein PHW60_02895 [Kiritimatiellae bacterium]|nr:hypothetical protein [Kiritimatiellia bacterium]